MRFLRTTSTRTLLGLIAALVTTIAGGAAISVAATSGGPVPPSESLATAMHDALSAPAPDGVSARITFTNNLIDSSQIESSDPLLTGATGRLWIAPGHVRLELQSDNGDGQLVLDGRSFWIYDPTTKTVYEGALPARGSGAGGPPDGTSNGPSAATEQTPSTAQLQQAIDKLADHVNGLDAVPTDIAGQPAYSVQLSPKESGGLFGSVELAWDAANGVPLDFAVYAKGDASPVVALEATSISYGSVPDSVFAISPPSGAKVVELSAVRDAGSDKGGGFLGFAGHGKGLDTVGVIESKGGEASPLSSADDEDDSPLALPTVRIGDATATELATELGTILEFSRGGTNYLVFGSVAPASAIAVARGL